MRIRRYPAPALISMTAALLFSGCASATQTTTVGSGPTSTPVATSVQDVTSVGVASPSMAYATADPYLPMSPTSSSTQTCRTNPLIIVYPPADSPLRSACLRMGVHARITLGAAGGWEWSPVVASVPAVVAVTDDVGPGHTHHVTVRPLHPGTVTLSSASSFTPDPHGPATQTWTLTLTIVP
jgi:hypothetical protein